jgi:hypothetical protein
VWGTVKIVIIVSKKMSIFCYVKMEAANFQSNQLTTICDTGRKLKLKIVFAKRKASE